jgi:acyl transferase domain-containing protein
MTSPDAQQIPAAAMRRALATIERLQRRIEEYEHTSFEPVAVVGLACRFPGGAVDAASYWDLLVTGTDAVGETPGDRWDVAAYYDPEPLKPGKVSSRWGGFLPSVDRFDHPFFGISRREAMFMDPQQRLALEVSWEALEDAGQAPDRLAGTDTAVFLGICGTDYANQLLHDPDRIAAHATAGIAHSVAAGRLSYLLDLKGPSVAVDTACSSSLVAVHQACQSLRLRESDLAICGAVNLVLSPQVGISLSQIPESFARDGRCKAFDAGADGYVRGEGCGIVILKRLSEAQRDGNRILAVIRASVVNQDGRSAGLTAPSGAAQRALLRRGLDISGIRADQVGYIEAHGTGTKLGDPIEADALAEVYGRPAGPPLYLGAVKTNLGHLEAAAGMAGLIKAVLCLQRGLIPPNLHFTRLSPHISLEGTTLTVPTRLSGWPEHPGPRIAGVSSFALSGTNAHLLLEQAPAVPPAEPDDRRPRSLLALSAKTGTALLKLARRYEDRLGADGYAAADACYSANTGRAHFPYRLAVVGESTAEIAERLADYVRGEPGPGLAEGRAGGPGAFDPVFLFSGAGPQRIGMAAELYRTQPTFRRVLERCDEILRSTLKTPLLAALYPEDGGSAVVDDAEYVAAGMFAIEYALAQLWRSWGVEPVAVIGHSLGEYVAACVAGVMSLADGLRLTTERGRILREFAGPGAMATVSASREEVAEELARYEPAQVSIAAVNGPATIAISGEAETVAEICARLQARSVKVRQLRVPRSGHSALVEPALRPLREALERVSFAPPRIPLVSNVTGQLWPWDKPLDADYWCRHTRQPVLFAEGITTLYDLGHRTFLEIGPSTGLLGLTGEILSARGDAVLLPSLRPNRGDWEVLLSTVSQLYVLGVGIDWSGFDRDYARSPVPLPFYPFDPVRCWHGLTGDDTRFVWRRAEGAGPPPAAAGDDQPEAVAATTGRRRVSGLPTAEELLRMPADARIDTLVSRLLDSARSALGSRSSIMDPDEPLSALGLDSLMAVELRNEIQGRLDVSVTVASFLSGATIRTVAKEIVTQVEGRGPDTADPGPAIRRVERVEDVAADLLARIEALPDGVPALQTNAEANNA